ncbi:MULTISPECIES: hypothetical protein [Streptomyces]|uniref:hypothetical protein n=1 Tax=Streptomyces TaxID=1883 RepID=UPI000B20C767|nr:MULTISPECIES: hypothetical protein [Streptomyces]
MDRNAWHGKYDTADSWMARRLRTVRQQIRHAPDDAPAGPLKAVSLCVGEGRGLLHVLARHPRRHEVRARLVEPDPRNAEAASDTARRAHLDGTTWPRRIRRAADRRGEARRPVRP